jgi:hypothetical protein
MQRFTLAPAFLVPLLAFAACSASVQHTAQRGQTAAQQAEDVKACDDLVAKDQGGAMGGNRNVALGTLMAGAVGAAAAKEAQERYDKCMAERGYVSGAK